MTQFNRLHADDSFIQKIYEKNHNNVIDYELFCLYFKRFSEKLREISKKNNLLLIDLENQIPSNRMYIYDAVHLNNAGSELVADIITKELQRRYFHLITK